MDIKQIQELIKFVSKSGVNEVAIEQKEFKLTIKITQASTFVTANISSSNLAKSTARVPFSEAASAEVLHTMVGTKTDPAVKSGENSKLLTIKSPMIGTFYRSPSPDKPYYINVGDEIQAGQVVCIIEAMKLFNEIESDISGRVVKVLVENAHPVEYDQPLFLIEPL